LARRDERQGGLVELRRVRETAVPEQVTHFLEARAARQVVDVVAAVGEAAVLAVEIAELGLGGDDALESPDELAAFRVHDRLPLEFTVAPRPAGPLRMARLGPGGPSPRPAL